MDEEPIEESYFNWLCAKVLSIQGTNHWELMRILNRTEFVWLVPGDRNRAADGVYLRNEFLNTVGLESDRHWFEQPCSLLEMFIAFSRKAAFQMDTDPREWFWIFLRNLRLDEYTRVTGGDRATIDNILHTFVWRLYEYDGDGGMFPLRNPQQDQRRVEIWYQFCEYLEDQGLLDDLV